MNPQARPRRIAQMIEVLESGGAEALAVDIAGALAERGHDARVVVLNATGTFQARLSPSVRCHDLNRPRRDGNQLGRILYFLETCRRLELLLRRERIEVLQCHLPKANFLGLAMAWRGVCRVLVTVHNNREFEYGDGAGAFKQWLRRAGYRQMLRRCDAVIAVSDVVRQSLLTALGTGQDDGDRVRVVANGVRVPPLASATERSVARAAWGVGADELLVVGVGRLTAQKDFGTLVRALSVLPDEGPAWRCVIAGEGEQHDEVARLADEAGLADRIRLAGLVTDVRDLLVAADIFCLPSRYEGLPLVLLEAMAAGLPVAAFAIAGVADVVTDGIEARLAPAGDANALGGVLAALMQDGDMRRALGAAGRALVVDRYGFDRVIDQLEAAYGAR